MKHCTVESCFHGLEYRKGCVKKALGKVTKSAERLEQGEKKEKTILAASDRSWGRKPSWQVRPMDDTHKGGGTPHAGMGRSFRRGQEVGSELTGACGMLKEWQLRWNHSGKLLACS